MFEKEQGLFQQWISRALGYHTMKKRTPVVQTVPLVQNGQREPLEAVA